MIQHIKGTLIQFLKNTPVTDRNNEGLLTVIFSMMEFQKEEIEEVQEHRRRQRCASQSSGQIDTEEEVKKKTSKGIFGMFKKKGTEGKEHGSA